MRGFFSYGMNIDLKREYVSSEGVYVAMPYPQMPKTTALPKPSATVFLFDMAFNSKEFPYANLYYSVNPAGRWTVFARRHCAGEGSVLAFVDGHCGDFKWSYVFNQNNPAVVDIGEPRAVALGWYERRCWRQDPGRLATASPGFLARRRVVIPGAEAKGPPG